MNKYLALLLVTLELTSCTMKDEHYYRTHPKELQAAMKTCEEQKNLALTCPKLEKIAIQMNELAYQLQLNPQGFGNKILSLQQTIASQQKQLNQKDSNSELKAQLHQNKQELADLLSVVKWLESPVS